MKNLENIEIVRERERERESFSKPIKKFFIIKIFSVAFTSV